MKYQSESQLILNGKNIYRSKNGQAIYYVSKEKTGYKIPVESEGLFQTLLIRHYVSVIVGLLTYFTLIPNIIISILIPLIIFILMEWKFRHFLKGCGKILNYKPHQRESIKEKEAPKSSIGRIFFFFLIGFLLIVNAFLSEEIRNIPFTFFGSFLAASFSLYLSWLSWKMYKNNENIK